MQCYHHTCVRILPLWQVVLSWVFAIWYTYLPGQDIRGIHIMGGNKALHYTQPRVLYTYTSGWVHTHLRPPGAYAGYAGIYMPPLSMGLLDDALNPFG